MSTDAFEKAIGNRINAEVWETPVTSVRIENLLGRLSVREVELAEVVL